MKTTELKRCKEGVYDDIGNINEDNSNININNKETNEHNNSGNNIFDAKDLSNINPMNEMSVEVPFVENEDKKNKKPAFLEGFEDDEEEKEKEKENNNENGMKEEKNDNIIKNDKGEIENKGGDIKNEEKENKKEDEKINENENKINNEEEKKNEVTNNIIRVDQREEEDELELEQLEEFQI